MQMPAPRPAHCRHRWGGETLRGLVVCVCVCVCCTLPQVAALQSELATARAEMGFVLCYYGMYIMQESP